MIATLISTHVEDGLARLLEQYKGRPNMAAFFTAFLQHVQQLENALFGIPAAFQLFGDVAVGAQLDVIGELVGAERNGLSDVQYRAYIRGTIAKNTGDATVETILAIIRGLFQTDSVFLKQPNSCSHTPQSAGATISISVGDPTIPEGVLPVVEAALKSALSAGVGINYIGQFTASAGTFAFAGPQPWVRGFGSVKDATAGAGLASILFNQPSS